MATDMGTIKTIGNDLKQIINDKFPAKIYVFVDQKRCLMDPFSSIGDKPTYDVMRSSDGNNGRLTLDNATLYYNDGSNEEVLVGGTGNVYAKRPDGDLRMSRYGSDYGRYKMVATLTPKQLRSCNAKINQSDDILKESIAAAEKNKPVETAKAATKDISQDSVVIQGSTVAQDTAVGKPDTDKKNNNNLLVDIMDTIHLFTDTINYWNHRK